MSPEKALDKLCARAALLETNAVSAGFRQPIYNQRDGINDVRTTEWMAFVRVEL